MKSRFRFCKSILILFAFLLLIPMKVNASNINLALDKFRGKDSDGTFPAYTFANQYIYKIYEINNGESNYNRPIYCLDAVRGFNNNGVLSTNVPVTYNKSLNMLDTTDKETIKGYEANNTSFEDEDYDKIIKILQNIYISGITNKEEFLKKMIPGFENDEYYVTDKDIEVAQQLAIWHYTNDKSVTNDTTYGNMLGNDSINDIYAAIYSNEQHTEIAGPIKYLIDNKDSINKSTYLTDNDYYSLKTVDAAYEGIKYWNPTTLEYIGKEEYKGMWNKFKSIQQIYASLISIAESTEQVDYTNVKPLEMENINSSVEEFDNRFIIGPFKIKENNKNYTEFALKVTDENKTDIGDYKILDSTKNEITTTTLIGQEFYISVSNNINLNKIKVGFSAKYNTNEITYWIDSNNVKGTQPVAIVDRTTKDLYEEKEVLIPKKEKKVDFSLRKFISGVNDEEYAGTSKDRQPKVIVTNLTTGLDTTATYNHTKTPVSVKVGDIVTYTIRVYNEGELNGYIGEVKDYLPEELTFLSDNTSTEQKLKEAAEFNAAYGWQISGVTGEIYTTILSKNAKYASMQEELIKAQNRESALLKAFDGNELDYIDLKVKCVVNEKASSQTKPITNISEITSYELEDGTPITSDIDSQTIDTGLFPNDLKNNDYVGKETVGEYVKGQQDDDDFDSVIVKNKFDLSLRKYISEVNGAKTTGREPVVDVSKLTPNGTETTAEYNHSKKPLNVTTGSIITYTIESFNEGEVDGYANEITDYLPEELEFIEDSEINIAYHWTKDEQDSRKITTDYLQYKEGKDTNLLKAYDGSQKLDSKTVKVQCKVKSNAPYGKNITNLAQITKESDSQGKEIEDRDSIPNDNFGLPKDEDLPNYKTNEESKNYVPGQEDDDDYEKVNVVYFDLALRKIVSKAIVTENGEEKVTQTNHKFEDDPEEIVKVDIGRKNINKITVKFEYQIRVTNEGTIEGYAKEIKDYIPEGLEFKKEDNPLWTSNANDGTITTDQLKDTLLKPGESKVVTVLLTWKNSSENLGLKTNTAEISKDYNNYNAPDIDSTPDNKKDGEDDIDIAQVMLSITLGKEETYIGLALVILVTTAAGVFLIKKYVL